MKILCHSKKNKQWYSTKVDPECFCSTKSCDIMSSDHKFKHSTLASFKGYANKSQERDDQERLSSNLWVNIYAIIEFLTTKDYVSLVPVTPHYMPQK